jgi:hypothetical protein
MRGRVKPVVAFLRYYRLPILGALALLVGTIVLWSVAAMPHAAIVVFRQNLLLIGILGLGLGVLILLRVAGKMM